MIYVSFVEV